MLLIYRLGHLASALHIPLIPRLAYLVNRILFAVVLPPTARIGRNVVIAYSGLGTVIHARAVIGDRVYIGPGVVIGGRSGLERVPVIEDDVEIGARACVLGPINIGRGSKIGAGAIVVRDVAAGSTVKGMPAA
ncbi:serine O-acetyltransferase [Ramlibacter sp. MMS24-I3-19]|uniref:serine O-acetyltransferase n=1 Tax=Ramlibacter sp. MMS24-I3-19 TaxID=3416606 RepID=UPI003D03F21A